MEQKKRTVFYASILLLAFVMLMSGCGPAPTPMDRKLAIPANAVKMTPELDEHPPILHSEEFENPVPFVAVNTAGGEDSSFIPDDGSAFYFFFTPDVSIPAEKQVGDGVTGIYVSRLVNGAWQEPERVMLQKSGKLALDGCGFVQGNKMLFCTAREGFTGLHWFSAEYKDGRWRNWKQADFNPKYEVGELHITSDGQELYFHSLRAGGEGSYDIWVSKNVDGKWDEPYNLYAVNSAETDGWPYVTPDKQELWFTRTYQGSPAVFRSKREGSGWGKPEMMVSQFAGEPTLDKEGNLYFTHHYYNNTGMIEADIYVAYRK
ncbi:hypothetical protein KY363_05030 [Candidatus Woesearchaeota archaeon]|nr:hypothetical protein [Candidatus Woesearchaeota archaeon]